MSNMNLTREEYDRLNGRRRYAFEQIAKALGKNHAITKMMGGLSYGRHRREQGVNGSLRKAAEELGFLDGYFDCLNLWARDHDSKAQQVMLGLYPSGYHLKD